MQTWVDISPPLPLLKWSTGENMGILSFVTPCDEKRGTSAEMQCEGVSKLRGHNLYI